jgi:uncharacterized membrane protein YphA (DoxX/SURF4 family)
MNEQMNDERLERVWWILKLTFGLVPIVAGLDKFLGLLADWEGYVSPLARSLLPMDVSTFMNLVGVIEIVAGLLVLSRYTRVGAYVVSAWLVAIALQLLTSGRFFDVAVRDVVMAIAAFSFGQLDAVRARVPRRGQAHEPSLAAPTAAPSAAR